MGVAKRTYRTADSPASTPAMAAHSRTRRVSTPSRNTPSNRPSVTDAMERPDSSTDPQWRASIPIRKRPRTTR